MIRPPLMRGPPRAPALGPDRQHRLACPVSGERVPGCFALVGGGSGRTNAHPHLLRPRPCVIASASVRITVPSAVTDPLPRCLLRIDLHGHDPH